MTKLSLREEVKNLVNRNRGITDNSDSISDEILSLVKKQVLESLPKRKNDHKHMFVFENRGKCQRCGVSWNGCDKLIAYDRALSEVKQNIHKIFKGK